MLGRNCHEVRADRTTLAWSVTLTHCAEAGTVPSLVWQAVEESVQRLPTQARGLRGGLGDRVCDRRRESFWGCRDRANPREEQRRIRSRACSIAADPRS